MQKPCLFLTLLAVLLTACGTAEPVAQGSQSATPTVSLLPGALPSQAPTRTALPPTLTAVLEPIEGTLTIKVNVRSGPGTNFDSIGLLEAGEKVQVLVHDETGKWYQILYAAAPDGSGWVAAQFVRIPVWTQVALLATPTPSGPTGRVLQRLNVRSGPGLSYDALGMLEANAVVSLTGKNSSASWFQIAYPAGTGGRGWISAQYLQTDATDLPVLDDFGTPATGGTPVASGGSGPTPIPVAPTPTVGPAFADADSAANPAVRVTFSASGTHQFTFSSQVSAPEGDPEDWIAFTPYAINAAAARLVFSLTCSGNGALTVEISQGSFLPSGWGTLSCGDLDKTVMLPAGQGYTLHLAPVPGAGLRLVDYVLTVQNKP
jgi:uncharacterized protein YraI